MKEKLQLLGILIIATIGLTVIGQFSHHLVMTGVIMGILAICGIGILWIKSPPFIKRFLAKGDVLVDAAATIGIFAYFGLTVTGLIGASVTCIFLSILLKANRMYQG